MTLKNVRERTTAIARLSRALAALPDDIDQDMQATVRNVIAYLISQFKVNFRPLWAETVSALSVLARRQGEDVWLVVWQELQKTHEAKVALVSDLGVENPSWSIQHNEAPRSRDDDEEDPEFRCPNLDKARKALSTAWADASYFAELERREIDVSICSFVTRVFC
jgi:U3 small nucleolar RNA-associated protein 20